MKKRLSKLLRWETMLVILLIVLWVVFEARDNSLDAALIAKGRKAKDVFNITKMLNGILEEMRNEEYMIRYDETHRVSADSLLGM